MIEIQLRSHISSRFNKLRLLSENSINANDTMRKEMEFDVYFALQYLY